MMALLESGLPFDYITVMIQSEVADRLCAKAGGKAYGAITAVLGYYGKARKLFKVSAGCFVPAPKVDSAVVRIDLYKEKPYQPKDEKLFRALIRAAFEMRRKTFVNAVAAKLPYSKDVLVAALASIGQDENVRGERLSTEDYVRLADYLSENK
jgi:16S rRNA (adenine1518-N6/adenine1519-N6)-dimethyltransferase